MSEIQKIERDNPKFEKIFQFVIENNSELENIVTLDDVNYFTIEEEAIHMHLKEESQERIKTYMEIEETKSTPLKLEGSEFDILYDFVLKNCPYFAGYLKKEDIDYLVVREGETFVTFKDGAINRIAEELHADANKEALPK